MLFLNLGGGVFSPTLIIYKVTGKYPLPVTCITKRVCHFIYKSSFFLTDFVSCCRHWTCRDEWWWPSEQHRTWYQLPCLIAEEELAECTIPLHQEHHGTSTTHLLNDVNNSLKTINFYSCTILILGFLVSKESAMKHSYVDEQ